MKIAVFVLLALAAGPVLAADECTFTYNSTSRRVEQRCTGILRDAPLGARERILLSSKQAKVCVVRVEKTSDNRLQMSTPECK